MNIAICDDDPKITREISNMIDEYTDSRNFRIVYETFLNCTSLENRIGEFDMFILDYKLPEYDGLTLAKKIREKYDDNKGIIFITAHSDIVYDVFEVRTHRFLIKPIDQGKLFKALDDFIKTNSVSRKITVKSDDTTYIINADEIVYMEVCRKDTYIYLSNNRSIKCHRTIASLEEQLKTLGFFRIHRSFLINLDKIRKFDSKLVELVTGEKIFISSKKYKNFCEEYDRKTKSKI